MWDMKKFCTDQNWGSADDDSFSNFYFGVKEKKKKGDISMVEVKNTFPLKKRILVTSKIYNLYRVCVLTEG